ncbi:Protein of unknown function (DUF3093) [Prauserella shujinwangii]|uniref:DUF3093 family protein n=1 Tax=Prauserella shujinwangii TaxID=1453103 RepID=A0A2T0M3D7_9PSEU|nr:DUF3093 domain-containing protein [Prauserella shujinwangii]PRX51265.1 Protein of unknown function (DUF3093) [Prauserella shujinwangii]
MSDDASAGGDGARDAAPDTVYTERLSVSWWAWPLPLIAATLLAAEIHMGYPGVRAWLPYAVLLPLTVLLILGAGRARVRVTACGAEPELWAGDAHLPLRFVGQVDVIGKRDKRKALGPELDPAAFVLHRGWIPTLVRVHLTDPADPTPYWVISTRRPDRLAGLLRAHAPEATSPPAGAEPTERP